MPVWHEATRDAREAGELQVIGIVQEQHRERAMLYRNWLELDWPILWDPFNVTESAAVPNIVFVDEHGIVRKVRPRVDRFEDDCLFADFPAPKTPPPEAPGAAEHLARLDDESLGELEREHLRALSDLLWRREGVMDAAVATLARHAGEHPDDARLQFHAGVARRLRYDSPARRPDDFQGAVDGWTRALAHDPNQYIWRRRIQQYGPRLDKPYPFYDWVNEALENVGESGWGIPSGFDWDLTPAEKAEPRRTVENREVESAGPDPEGRIRRDEGWIGFESAVAFATRKDARVASVHLAFRPDAERKAHWFNGVDPMRLWIDAPDLPEGWTLDHRLLEHGNPGQETSTEVRRFTVELGLPEGVDEAKLTGYLLFHACEDVGGTCVFLRRDFEVEVRRPR